MRDCLRQHYKAGIEVDFVVGTFSKSLFPALRLGFMLVPEPLVETFRRGSRHYLVAYPFEGRLAHQTLGMLLTRRLHRIGAGVFLTGGVSLMKGIENVANEVFGRKVTRAGSAPVSGISSTFENPQFSAPIGLIRYAQILDQEKPFMSPLKRLGRRMADLLTVAV